MWLKVALVALYGSSCSAREPAVTRALADERDDVPVIIPCDEASDSYQLRHVVGGAVKFVALNQVSTLRDAHARAQELGVYPMICATGTAPTSEVMGVSYAADAVTRGRDGVPIEK
jgi:hypothetical protein